MDYGVDVGQRKVAVACPEEGWARAYTVHESTPHLEKSALSYWLVEQLDGDTDARLWVESAVVAGARNLQSSIGIAMTVGALISDHPTRQVTLVPPSTWKKTVTGHGEYDKQQVAEWLEQHHPALAEACRKPSGKLDQDRVDATCLGLHGRIASSELGLARARRVPRSRSHSFLRSG